MLTPQEVGEKAFPKAAFGGYNMPLVDEFLDVLTADYSALYTENAVLKSKLKVMVDKVEEYRSTEEAMRKALMAAQRMADETIHTAEEQKRSIVEEAEQLARAKVFTVRAEREAEELRLAEAQRAVLEFTAQAKATYERNIAYLDSLFNLCPAPPIAPAPVVEAPVQTDVDEVVEDIEENVQRILEQAMADVAAAQEESLQEEGDDMPLQEYDQYDHEEQDDDLDFTDLEFGDNYQRK